MTTIAQPATTSPDTAELRRELAAATRTACGGWIRGWIHDPIIPAAMATGEHNGHLYRVVVSWISGDWVWTVSTVSFDKHTFVAKNLDGERTAEEAVTQAVLAYASHAAENSPRLPQLCRACGLRHCICQETTHV